MENYDVRKTLIQSIHGCDYETAEDHKSKFTEIGAAWPIKDGKATASS
jgi:hypothetical protein